MTFFAVTRIVDVIYTASNTLLVTTEFSLHNTLVFFWSTTLVVNDDQL